MDGKRCPIGLLHHQCVWVDKACPAPNQADARVISKNALVLGMAQFIDTGLLLRHQRTPVDIWLIARNTVERMRRLQMGNMGGTNHDLGWHAADIDAGAADDIATFDHRYPGPFLNRPDGCGESAGAGSDDSDM